GLGHGFLVGLELFGPRIDFALEYGHFPCLLIRGHPGVAGVPPGNRYEHPLRGPASNRRLLSFGCA
ncbi:MAG: hypothetical protein VYE45_03060, partial [Pseudomonadota bacterium]|nr:hypothetical protein [Pseudomonadota bacterium]